jgi:hypothetical protein
VGEERFDLWNAHLCLFPILPSDWLCALRLLDVYYSWIRVLFKPHCTRIDLPWQVRYADTVSV